MTKKEKIRVMHDKALLVAAKVIGFYAGRMLELNQVINQL